MELTIPTALDEADTEGSDLKPLPEGWAEAQDEQTGKLAKRFIITAKILSTGLRQHGTVPPKVPRAYNLETVVFVRDTVLIDDNGDLPESRNFVID